MHEDDMSETLAFSLDFTSRVTRSSTHEIKNELAVMNEQSRLVHEMLTLYRRGREPDFARLENLMERVIARVASADQAVRRLNAFAQLADLERVRTDPGEVIRVLLALCARTAALNEVELIPPENAAGKSLPLRPIIWGQAVWACLELILEEAPRGARLWLELPHAGDSNIVLFRLDPPLALQCTENFRFASHSVLTSRGQDGELVLDFGSP